MQRLSSTVPVKIFDDLCGERFCGRADIDRRHVQSQIHHHVYSQCKEELGDERRECLTLEVEEYFELEGRPRVAAALKAALESDERHRRAVLATIEGRKRAVSALANVEFSDVELARRQAEREMEEVPLLGVQSIRTDLEFCDAEYAWLMLQGTPQKSFRSSIAELERALSLFESQERARCSKCKTPKCTVNARAYIAEVIQKRVESAQNTARWMRAVIDAHSICRGFWRDADDSSVGIGFEVPHIESQPLSEVEVLSILGGRSALLQQRASRTLTEALELEGPTTPLACTVRSFLADLSSSCGLQFCLVPEGLYDVGGGTCCTHAATDKVERWTNGGLHVAALPGTFAREGALQSVPGFPQASALNWLVPPAQRDLFSVIALTVDCRALDHHAQTTATQPSTLSIDSFRIPKTVPLDCVERKDVAAMIRRENHGSNGDRTGFAAHGGSLPTTVMRRSDIGLRCSQQTLFISEMPLTIGQYRRIILRYRALNGLPLDAVCFPYHAELIEIGLLPENDPATEDETFQRRLLKERAQRMQRHHPNSSFVPPATFSYGTDDQPLLVPFWVAEHVSRLVDSHETSETIKLVCRLPLIEEHEVAVRGVEGYLYPWGNLFDPAEVYLSGDTELRENLDLPKFTGFSQWARVGEVCTFGRYEAECSPFGLRGVCSLFPEWNCVGREYFSSAPVFPCSTTGDFPALSCLRSVTDYGQSGVFATTGPTAATFCWPNLHSSVGAFRLVFAADTQDGKACSYNWRSRGQYPMLPYSVFSSLDPSEDATVDSAAVLHPSFSFFWMNVQRRQLFEIFLPFPELFGLFGEAEERSPIFREEDDADDRFVVVETVGWKLRFPYGVCVKYLDSVGIASIAFHTIYGAGMSSFTPLPYWELSLLESFAREVECNPAQFNHPNIRIDVVRGSCRLCALIFARKDESRNCRSQPRADKLMNGLEVQ